MNSQQLFVVGPDVAESGCSRSGSIGLALDVDPAVATLDELRDAVEDEFGIPGDEQNLVAGNRLLTTTTINNNSSSSSLLPPTLQKAFRRGFFSSTPDTPTLSDLGVQPGSTIHVDRKVRGGGGVFGLLREVRGFYNPFIGLGYWFFPCALNVYGIYKFKHQNFWENKPVRDASAFTGEKSSGGGGGH